MLERYLRIYTARILVLTDNAFFRQLLCSSEFVQKHRVAFPRFGAERFPEISISSIKPVLTANENLFIDVVRRPNRDAVAAPTFSCTWIPY